MCICYCPFNAFDLLVSKVSLGESYFVIVINAFTAESALQGDKEKDKANFQKLIEYIKKSKKVSKSSL